MAVNTGMASYPAGIRRSRFSWHFYTPGRRRWVMVQIVSGPCDQSPDEQDAPVHAVLLRKAPSQARLLDSYTGDIWRRRSF